jgi:hypothetical protein
MHANLVSLIPRVVWAFPAVARTPMPSTPVTAWWAVLFA